MTLYNRMPDVLENMGRQGAQILHDTDSTRLVRVLNLFDLFVLKDDISLAPHLTNDGYWESWITSWFTRWVRPGMSVLDIGANSGYYTLLSEKLVGKHGTVVAYEASPVYAELLRQTRSHNDASFKIREVAVSDNTQGAILTVPENYHGSASIETDFPQFEIQRQYEVDTTTLDQESQMMIFARHDIVKIDAEGSEERIWRGGHAVWDCEHHTTLLLEYTPGAYGPQFLEDLYAWGDVKTIDFDGSETPVSRDWILGLTDWRMLVVRKK